MSEFNVLSTFDGYASCREALERLGFWVDNYFASEIDPYSMKIANKNYPDIKQLGDVTKVKGADLPSITLLAGGSPCQGFSFAGRQLNFNDPRSKLFFEFVRLKEECDPVYFFLENVNMKKEYQDVISKYLGVEPIFLNSEKVSAQSRPRLYWTNIPGYTEPEQKGLILHDVLEHDIPFDRVGTSFNVNPSGNGMNGKLHLTNRKAPCLTTNKGEGVKVTPALYPGAIRGRYLNKAVIVGRRLDEKGTRKDYDKKVPITQCLEVRSTNTDKSNCLTTVGKDNVLTTLPPGRYPDAYKNNLPYRKLTPIEYERLQTLPDNYTAGVSNSQRYKMLGNGWTVDAICEFFKHIPKDLELL